MRLVYFVVGCLLAGLLAFPIAQRVTGKKGAAAQMLVEPDTASNRQLLKAMERSDPDEVRRLLAAGADADAKFRWEWQQNRTPIAFMAMGGEQVPHDRSVALLRLMVKAVRQVDATDDNGGRTLLSIAIVLGDLDSVKLLVDRGANVNARGAHVFAGMTPLYFAVLESPPREDKLTPITAFLLDHGADPNIQNARGETVLMMAAQQGKAEVVKALLAKDADPAIRDIGGNTALDQAGLRGQDKVVRLLQGVTPMNLHEAARFGRTDRLASIPFSGPDVNALDLSGRTPLMEAMLSGDVGTAKFLVAHGADVRSKGRDGRTALHLAAVVGNTALMSFLIEKGADVNADAGRSHMNGATDHPTPLIDAVEQVQPEAVALLLHHKVDLAARDQGSRALEMAVQHAGQMPNQLHGMPRRQIKFPTGLLADQDRILSMLLGAGGDVRAHRSQALYLAADGGQLGIVKLLLAKGADANAIGPAPESKTALMGAVEAWSVAGSDEQMIRSGEMSGSTTVADAQAGEADAQKMLELLLARKADPNLADKEGQTPLMACVGLDVPGAVEVLLKAGAKIDAEDPAGDSVLIKCASDNDLKLATLLLAHRARVNQADSRGYTALMLAIDNGENDEARSMPAEYVDGDTEPVKRSLPNADGHPDMVRLLLRHGANPSVVAKDGMTARKLAKKEGFAKVLALLPKG